MWDVEYTDEFGDWWDTLTEEEQIDVRAPVYLLQQEGPNLRFPYSSSIQNSKHGHMRELRAQHKGNPFRIFYAFDPRRCAILLIGEIKQEMTIGMIDIYLLLTNYMMTILIF